MSATPSLIQARETSSPLTRRTFLPYVGLLCDGPEPHYADLPRVSTDGPTGAVECGECGAAMSVVDIITVERKASWSGLSYLGRGRRYFGQ
jgi:hypothetical protein